MKAGSTRLSGAVKIGVAVGVLAASAGAASAGGFAVREQSASLMGSAFAGAAAGVDLSSSFWNPAAFGTASDGFSTQSAYTLIVGDTELNNMSTTFGGFPAPIGGVSSTDIDKLGYLSSSYGAYRINDKLVLGASVTAPFGLATDNGNYFNAGRAHGVSAEMMTIAVNAALSYEVMKGVHLAAGPTFQYMKLNYWLMAPGSPVVSSLKFDDNFGVGFTAGILIDQGGTKFGVGFRSKVEQNLDGDGYNLGFAGPRQVSAELETPEMITASLVQSLSSQLRVLGTVEWTNWSRIQNVPITVYPVPGFAAPLGVLEAGWEDGWFFSGGLEYDYSPVLTVRAGGAYEISPIRTPTERLSVLPDSDRIWATAGATYKFSESTTFDLSYAHVFFEDSHLTRNTLNQSGLILDADVQNSADIFSVGMRTQW